MNISYIVKDKPERLPNFLYIINDSITIFNETGETFGISISVGEAIIYSVDTSTIEPTTKQSNQFSNVTNNCYTIYPTVKDIMITVSSLSGEQINYQIECVPFNEPQHYKDSIDNRNLPTYDELQQCIIFTDEYDKTNMVARMLLDANYLLKHKGNIIGIRKFLNFVGFPDSTFDLYREYKQPNNTKTTNPNKLVDVPTGYYHLIIRDYVLNESEPYTRKNLPNITNLINQSIDEFIDKLRLSFSVAMKYFTLAEQDISFIGIQTASNSMKFQSVAGNMNMITELNPQLFNNNIIIDCKNYYESDNFKYLIQHNIQSEDNVIYKSEVKYHNTTDDVYDIFLIDEEIFDDVYMDGYDSFTDLKRIFGVINHLLITSPNTYATVDISGIDNRFLNITIPKQWIGEEPLDIKFLCTQSGKYSITVTICDKHNNTEVYEYIFEISNTIINARFDVFTSHKVTDDKFNRITSDIMANSLVTYITDNYILPLHTIPDNLLEYYNKDIRSEAVRYMTNIKPYMAPRINTNYAVDILTETIPVDYIDNNLQVISFPISDDVVELVIRPKSIDKNLNENGPYMSLDSLYNHPNNFEPNLLFSTVMMVYMNDEDYNNDKLTKAIFISTTEPGIDINYDLFDLALKYKDGTVKSIYELYDPNTVVNVAVNHDFPLFHRLEPNEIESNKLVWPKFVYNIDKPQDSPIIKTLFTRLNKVSDGILRMGDFIVGVIDGSTIVNEYNLSWKVYNSFTGEMLYNTNNYSLKYRINENTVYTIVLEIVINNIVNQEKYTIDARNIVASFK